MDSGYHAVDFGLQVLDFSFFVGETWIPDSSRKLDSGDPELFSGFQSPGFQIPRIKIYQIPETGLPLMGD